MINYRINLYTHLFLGATYVGTKQFSPSEAFPVILGDIDPSGNLNANIIHQFSPNIRCKFASQVSIIVLSAILDKHMTSNSNFTLK